ncbi:MAG: MFS transporter [Nitrospinaceae bacterium]|nr:MAG: MFS transporter [Nitrospinaceae bacterium]
MIENHAGTATLKQLINRRIGVVVFLGFASGLPLALSRGTLQAWMTVENVDLATIGLFSLVATPYTLKFLWAPFLDRYLPPWLGRRRGWMFLFQAGLLAFIAAMSFSSLASAPGAVALMALVIATLSASQDIVTDAYRTDVLKEPERGAGAAVFVTGYRVAMLVSGALALVLADHVGWRMTYLIMAALMTMGIAATLVGPEPEERFRPPATMEEAVMGPLKEFFGRSGAWAFLGLIVLYKLGDAFAGSLTTAFLIRGSGFSLSEVGLINKGLGLGATIAGALFGGVLFARLGLYRSLMAFGVLQAVSNLSFMVLAMAGKSYVLMVFAVGFENIAGGMGTASFVAFLMALCDHRFTATQYALLSALAAIGSVYAGPASGVLAKEFGWAVFFFLTFLAALPGLGLLWRMKPVVKGLEHAKRPAA